MSPWVSLALGSDGAWPEGQARWRNSSPPVRCSAPISGPPPGMRPGQGCLGLAKPGRPEVGDGPLRIEAGRLSSLSRDTQGPDAGFGPTSPDPKASGLAPPAHVSTLIVYTSAFPAFLAVDSSSVEIFTEFLWPQRK